MSINPQPKGLHLKPSPVIDWRLLALPKNDPVRDEDYRTFVRKSGPCWLPNHLVPCGRKPERGETESAHLPFSSEKGVARKVSDAACACLCPVHHDLLDGYTLSYQIIAFLWMRALFLRETWWRSRK